MATTKSGAKGRKIGRSKERPSNIRYTNEQRWLKNKKLAIARDAKMKAKHKAKKGVAA